MSDRLTDAVAELVAALRDELAAERPSDAGPGRLLGIDEAAALLGLGRSRLYNELQAGRLRSIKVGRRRLVPAAAISEFVGQAAEAPGRP